MSNTKKEHSLKKYYEKRLAIQIEDHPYPMQHLQESFPKGTMGLELLFSLDSEKNHGTYALVRFKNKDQTNAQISKKWLLIKTKK